VTLASKPHRWQSDHVGRRRKSSGLVGVLVIDKPSGVTSHDVVQRVRKRLGEGRVGHAGTLDPMATGVLVVMVGEATKLAPFLTADDKSYRATVQLGRATDTLDAEGETTQSKPLPSWWTSNEARDRVDAALEQERQRSEQAPPVYSAIKVDGRTAHARTRAGESVDLAPRPVAVRRLSLEALGVDAGTLELSMTVAKGYYVRALARDLGEQLGVPAHLCRLRRSASGVFEEEHAVALDAELKAALITPEDAAARAMSLARLTDSGTSRARHGGPMTPEDFVELPPLDGTSAWLSPAGELVAIGRMDGDKPAVVRGFVAAGSEAS
jgi:tRNA pseudouridine55 synthase